MGQSCWIDDDQIQRKRTHSLPSHESIVWRNAQKQRRWTIINTLLCRWEIRLETVFLHNHFCQSAEYLRSSLRIVWIVQYLSNKHRETYCGREIRSIVRASKITDIDTHTLDWDSCTRNVIAEVQRTSGKVSTTRSIDKDLFWCRIPETVEVGQYFMTKHTDEFLQFTEPVTCCEYTLLRDEESTNPEGFEGTPKLNPCWKSQPVTCKVNLEWELEMNCKQTILTRGSEFLMDWTSWSQSWPTRSTTTTSRRTLRRIRNYLRWRRKYLYTQAVQRIKQNQADLPLLAHLQELYLFRERIWIDIEPVAPSDQAYPVARRLNTLHRHGEMPREEDGAIEFWRLKDDRRTKVEHSQYLSDEMWKSKMTGGGRQQERISILYWSIRTRNSLLTQLFEVIQEEIPLSSHSTTMCWFRTTSSSTFIISDVQSV